MPTFALSHFNTGPALCPVPRITPHGAGLGTSRPTPQSREGLEPLQRGKARAAGRTRSLACPWRLDREAARARRCPLRLPTTAPLLCRIWKRVRGRGCHINQHSDMFLDETGAKSSAVAAWTPQRGKNDILEPGAGQIPIGDFETVAYALLAN